MPNEKRQPEQHGNLDIPEFLRRQPDERPQVWEASRKPVPAALPEIKLSNDERWRIERDALYAQQAADHYAAQEPEPDVES